MARSAAFVSSPVAATPLDAITPSRGNSKGLVLVAVRDVVAGMTSTFTVRDVIAQLPPGSKLNSISSALRRLYETGVIIELKAGGGRRAAVYRRADSLQPGRSRAMA